MSRHMHDMQTNVKGTVYDKSTEYYKGILQSENFLSLNYS